MLQPSPATPPPYPFFIRMVRTEKGWGDGSLGQEQRIADALRSEFQVRDDENLASDISLFEVRDDTELRRCVIALCAGRDKPPGSKFLFVPVLIETVTSAGLALLSSVGVTPCALTNSFHWDARGTAEQVRAFYISQHRVTPVPLRVLKGDLSGWQIITQTEGCSAATGNGNCRVSTCPSSAPSTALAAPATSSPQPTPSL